MTIVVVETIFENRFGTIRSLLLDLCYHPSWFINSVGILVNYVLGCSYRATSKWVQLITSKFWCSTYLISTYSSTSKAIIFNLRIVSWTYNSILLGLNLILKLLIHVLSTYGSIRATIFIHYSLNSRRFTSLLFSRSSYLLNTIV